MKKFTKIFAMMLVVVMVVGMFSSVAMATTTFKSVSEQQGSSATSGINTKMNELGGSAIQIVKTLGFIIAVVMVFVYAIKWMMATPQKKQELKERLWYLAIGVVLLMGGPQLLDVIASAGQAF